MISLPCQSDRTRSARAAHTLIELIVSIALLGLLGAIVVQTGRFADHHPRTIAWQVDSVRAAAIQKGKAQHAFVRDSTRYGEILVLPTGEVQADASLRLQPITGLDRP